MNPHLRISTTAVLPLLLLSSAQAAPKEEWSTGSAIRESIKATAALSHEPNKAGEPWSFLMARNWKRTGWNQSALPGKYSSFGVPREQSRVASKARTSRRRAAATRPSVVSPSTPWL